MARINIDNEFWSDPRLDLMLLLKPKHECIGAVMLFWRLGQMYWSKGQRVIPKELFQTLPLHNELLQTKFAIEKEDGIYCVGSNERWGYLDPETHAIAGRKSAHVRKLKYGTALPPNASNNPAKIRTEEFEKPNDIHVESERLRTDDFKNRTAPNGSEPSSSSSSSSSKNNAKTKDEELRKYLPATSRSLSEQTSLLGEPVLSDNQIKKAELDQRQELCRQIWHSYSTAWSARYGKPPIRNGTVNAQIVNLSKRLGKSAIHVVAFYVGLDDPFYKTKTHGVGQCLADAESLHGRWDNGIRTTQFPMQQFKTSAEKRNEAMKKNAERLKELETQIAVDQAKGQIDGNPV